MRERSPASTIWADLTLPWLISTSERPDALVTPGKSRAMRAGVWTAKPVGSSVWGSENSMRSTSAPPCRKPVTDSMEPRACDTVALRAAAMAMPASHRWRRKRDCC